jgi:hypothetical protein
MMFVNQLVILLTLYSTHLLKDKAKYTTDGDGSTHFLDMFF